MEGGQGKGVRGGGSWDAWCRIATGTGMLGVVDGVYLEYYRL